VMRPEGRVVGAYSLWVWGGPEFDSPLGPLGVPRNSSLLPSESAVLGDPSRGLWLHSLCKYRQ
jgi:hypothetical protein